MDYLGVHLIDREARYMISRLDHPDWHDYYWTDNKVQKCPAIQQLSALEKDKQLIMFFQTYQSGFLYQIRGEIMGKVSPGFSILMGNPHNGNRIQFCITFQDGMSIDRLNANVLMQLVKDLAKMKSLLDPFMEYFTKVGNLAYGGDLRNFIKKNQLTFPEDL